MEKIQDIRIMQLDGMAGGGGGAGGGGRNATDEVINSALRYRVQAPLIDNLLSELGIDGGNLSRMPGLIREASDMQRISDAVKRAAGDGESGGGGGSETSDAPADPQGSGGQGS